uniref:COesterase domain-containing protein n=1 Tax=Rhodnius prolixus TaxID=13249 RepID=T1HI60_RHOPR
MTRVLSTFLISLSPFLILLVLLFESGHGQIIKLSNSNRKFLSFLNVRYAQPITAHFQDPVPLAAEPIQFYNGTDLPVCVQIDPISDPEKVIGQQDCLFLNIYTHQTNGSVPVMLWIHGGGWNFGSGNEEYFGPGALMDEDIVLVTINYRIGPLGFASLEDEILPGNYGLKDQAEAIKWVHKNIHNFGGDPQMITLFGQSVGAASVLYHMKGKLAERIRGGIAQSGSSLSPWAKGPPGAVRRMTLRLAENAGCKQTTTKEIADCLRLLAPEKLVEASKRFTLIEQYLLPFRPVMEKSGMVTEDPWDTPPSNLPLMTGFTSAEAAFIAALLTKEGGFIVRFINAAFDAVIPEILMYQETAPNPTEITAAIKKFYLRNESITLENLSPLINMMSDSYIVYPTYAEAQKHNGTLYTYLFNHKGEVSVAEILGTPVDLAELNPMLNTFLNLKNLNGDPLEGITNEHDWESTSKNGGYLQIDTDKYTLNNPKKGDHRTWLEQRLEFWNSLPYRLKNEFLDYMTRSASIYLNSFSKPETY